MFFTKKRRKSFWAGIVLLAAIAMICWLNRPQRTIAIQNISSLEEFEKAPGQDKTLAVVQEDCPNCQLLKQALEEGIAGDGVLYVLTMTEENRQEILDAVSLTVVPSFVRLEEGDLSVRVIRQWEQVAREVQNIIFS